MMHKRLFGPFLVLLLILAASPGPGSLLAQSPNNWKVDPTQAQDYKLVRVSSYDRSGGNADFRSIAAGQTLVVMDENGPGLITHVWFTLASGEMYHLKKLVLRVYWDDETTPSVETPLGDFFGLGLGEYHRWESEALSVASQRALNCYFAMPFQKHARITVENQGKQSVGAFYFNIDYRALSKPLPEGTLYFHAQFRQAQPNQGWTNQWQRNFDPAIQKKNLDGEGNYVWLEATGRGLFMGITMSVLQNQDDWWGEGDDMFFIDGETHPSITGTGSEDYFLGAFDFGEGPFSYRLYGAPVKGEERAGGRWSVYRFHFDSPIPFSKSIKATIEHGHANHRSDNFYSVAYWYQSEPHGVFPVLPPVQARIPKVQPVGGPGNSGGTNK
jgi:hypothetical protein